MKYTDTFRMIEQDLFAFLQSDPILGRRAGAVVEPGSVQSSVLKKVTEALAAGPDTKVGLGWIVLPIEDLIDADPEVEFGPLKLPIVVHIVESVILNQGPHGPKIPIRCLAAYTQKILKSYSATNLTTDLIPESDSISLFSKHDDENLRFCQIAFHTYESDPVAFQQVSSPFLTPSAPVSLVPGQNVYPMAVTILAPGVDAVYYTTDGSHPWEKNPAAVKWLGGAVNIQGKCFFRSRAFTAGQLGSKTSSIFFA
jgi:hypothetical protein